MTNECLCRKGDVRERHRHGLPQEQEEDPLQTKEKFGTHSFLPGLQEPACYLDPEPLTFRTVKQHLLLFKPPKSEPEP